MARKEPIDMPVKIERIYFGKSPEGRYMVIRFQREVGIQRSSIPDVGLTFEKYAGLFGDIDDTFQQDITEEERNIFDFTSPPPVTIDALKNQHRLIDNIPEPKDEGMQVTSLVPIILSGDASPRVGLHISESDYNLLAMARRRYREHHTP
jgi:hypothetical protein